MNNYKLVSSFSPTQVQTCNSTSRTVEKLNPDLPIIANYDEQIHLDFNQNFSSLQYNVTATEQNDSFGFGPTYLLDGATSAGLWYQTGLSWNWAISNSLAHYSGFQFAYEVWNVTSGKSVFPNALDTTSITSLNGNVNPGDLVELSLKFQNGNVIMSLRDWETGVFLQQNYSADSANYFTSGGTGGYSTGLMLEWYHVYPIFCTQNHVIFSTTGLPLSSATLCNDEWNLTNNDHNVYYGTCTGPIELPQELTQAAAFSYNGTISYANAHEFVVF